jgi:RNA 3'-terminal phosphate cyclase (ATP)
VVANLARTIAEREIAVIRRQLDWPEEELEVVEISASPGPGNVVMLELRFEHVTEILTGFGERRRPAEDVARGVVRQCRDYLARTAPAGEHLTDQLLLPLAVAGRGGFRSTGLSSHADTNLQVIRRFLDVPVATSPDEAGGMRVQIG